MMVLQQLRIERETYGPNKGMHLGKATFEGEGGSVEIKLTPDLCHRLFLLCAEGIITVAKEAASALVLEAQASVAKDAAPAAIASRR